MPWILIGKQRVGGNDQLDRFFDGRSAGEGEAGYRPVMAITGTAVVLALVAGFAVFGSVLASQAVAWFVS